jgi:hypothetical protein
MLYNESTNHPARRAAEIDRHVHVMEMRTRLANAPEHALGGENRSNHSLGARLVRMLRMIGMLTVK